MIEKLEKLSLEEGLALLSKEYEGNIKFSTSFGQEDQAIAHAIFSQNLPIEVFTLDTGRHFQETYEVMDKTRAKYKNPIVSYFPETEAVQKLTVEKGFNSFYESVENRKECCGIRKIEPLKRALKDTKVWITGLRAEQNENRSSMKVWEFDEGFQLYKYNPLINWSYEDVLNYLKENKIPENSLHAKGFISIGCLPCTRAISAGENPRDGRWWWEESKKECGLHAK